MPRIHLETLIAAPVELCFDLCLNVNVHEQAGHGRAVAGVTSGQMRLGDTVTWEAVHFGVRQHLTSEIIGCARPRLFVDEMQRGAFKRWRHTHRFEPQANATLMIDDVDFASPFGLFGKIVDALILDDYMTRFLSHHNRRFKELAETEARQAAASLAKTQAALQMT